MNCCWLKLWTAGWAKALFLEPRVTGRDLRDARLLSEPVTSRDSVLEMGPSPTAWLVCFSGEDTVNDGYSGWKPWTDICPSLVKDDPEGAAASSMHSLSSFRISGVSEWSPFGFIFDWDVKLLLSGLLLSVPPNLVTLACVPEAGGSELGLLTSVAWYSAVRDWTFEMRWTGLETLLCFVATGMWEGEIAGWCSVVWVDIVGTVSKGLVCLALDFVAVLTACTGEKVGILEEGSETEGLIGACLDAPGFGMWREEWECLEIGTAREKTIQFLLKGVLKTRSGKAWEQD